MKTSKLIAAAALAAASITPSMAQDVLTGDTKLSCEAILCLSTGQRPDECTPSLQRYFSINFDDWGDTIRERTNFLNLCPVVATDANMQALVAAIASGAGNCDVNSLNRYHRIFTFGSGTNKLQISNKMPSYCTAYYTNALTDLASVKPVYVGTPDNDGFWTTPDKYAADLATYNKAHNIGVQPAPGPAWRKR